LHAAVRCGASDRQALEHLCRCITRPALANERARTNAAGQVVLKLKLKTPWRDGTTHLEMSPLEFMQRLAALVARPRLHLIRFHGVRVPKAKLRALVVPQQAEASVHGAPRAECKANCAQWTRDNPQTTLKRPGFRLRRQRSADLSHRQTPTQARRTPSSGCRGERNGSV